MGECRTRKSLLTITDKNSNAVDPINKGDSNADFFAPDVICSRTEAAAFLNRFPGSVSGQSNGFTAVVEGSYYESAVA